MPEPWSVASRPGPLAAPKPGVGRWTVEPSDAGSVAVHAGRAYIHDHRHARARPHPWDPKHGRANCGSASSHAQRRVRRMKEGPGASFWPDTDRDFAAARNRPHTDRSSRASAIVVDRFSCGRSVSSPRLATVGEAAGGTDTSPVTSRSRALHGIGARAFRGGQGSWLGPSRATNQTNA